MVAQVSLASIMATISMVGKEQNYTTSGVLCVRDAPLRLMRMECPALLSDVVCFPWCEYLEDGEGDE